MGPENKSSAGAVLSALLLILAAPAFAVWWLGPTCASRWLDRPITIDGDAEDWRSQEIDDSGSLSFAFANDERDLYVLIVPHTRPARAQLAGVYGQDFTFWIDPKGGREHKLVITVRAPLGADKGRVVEAPAAAVAGSSTAAVAQAAMGDVAGRGAFEARIPLALLGSPRPGRVMVGVATSRLLRQPEAAGSWDRSGERRQGKDGRAARPEFQGFIDEDYLPIQLIVRVTLAAPPGVK